MSAKQTACLRRGLRRLVDWYRWPARVAHILPLRKHDWICSTAFSGIGCPEMAATSISRFVPNASFRFQSSLERDSVCREVLGSHSAGSICATDILNWLPVDVDRQSLSGLSLDELRARLLDSGIKLVFGVHGDRKYCHGELHVAGPPCVDFSAMGLQRRDRGPTMLVFMMWVMGLREQLPMVVLFENVFRFPLNLLESLL